MAAPIDAAQDALRAARFLASDKQHREHFERLYPTKDLTEQQRKRDIAAVAATRASNIESKKYPGLVCGDPSILIINEEVIAEAQGQGFCKLELFGDVVFLPDDLGDMFPDLLGFTCMSPHLAALPVSVRKMTKLRELTVSASASNLSSILPYLTSVSSTHPPAEICPGSLRRLANQRGPDRYQGVEYTIARHEAMINILLKRIEELEVKLSSDAN